MTILDANILVYAWDSDAPQHEKARTFVERVCSDSDWVGIPWVTIWAFLRVTTNPRLLPKPLTVERAFSIVDTWLAYDQVVSVQPGSRHQEILQRLMLESRVVGPHVTDAVLASLAIENGAILASSDHDFSRFKGLHWIDPLAA